MKTGSVLSIHSKGSLHTVPKPHLIPSSVKRDKQQVNRSDALVGEDYGMRLCFNTDWQCHREHNCGEKFEKKHLEEKVTLVNRLLRILVLKYQFYRLLRGAGNGTHLWFICVSSHIWWEMPRVSYVNSDQKKSSSKYSIFESMGQSDGETRMIQGRSMIFRWTEFFMRVLL